MKGIVNVRLALATLMSCGVLVSAGTAMATSLPRSISPQALAQEKGCFACHAIDHKVVGPAFKDVAAKYHHNLKYVPDLAKKIKNGNAGIWGPVPMPPQNVTQAQAEELARFILSLH
jgi:Cytochrome c551/c552